MKNPVVERLVKGRRLDGRTMWKALPGAQPKVLLSLPAEEEGEEQEKEE